jgi:hypothetical protein
LGSDPRRSALWRSSGKNGRVGDIKIMNRDNLFAELKRRNVYKVANG